MPYEVKVGFLGYNDFALHHFLSVERTDISNAPGKPQMFINEV